MKTVLQNLQNEPCRVHDISEDEMTTFSNYTHLQRYHPAIDLFKISDSVYSHKNVELPSKYHIDSWGSQDAPKIWNTVRKNGSELEPCQTFVKVIHLLNPIDMIKEKYTCPDHPLIPQSENTWKKTLQKIHNHNNQAYVDTVANFVLSRFRELNLTPHCVYYYGAMTGISKSYQYNISNEYNTYRQCRWFWNGLKSHNAHLTVTSDIPEDLHEEITRCPFDDSDIELEDYNIEISDTESVNSYTFDNIEENADNVNDIFEINNKIFGKLKLDNDVKEYEGESEGEEGEYEGEGEGDEGDEGDEYSDDELDICLEIPNTPVILIYQEAQEGVLDNLLEEELDGCERGSQKWEARWIAWLFQIIAALSFLQNALCFTHNDLHSNNILWRKTDNKFLFYRGKDGTVWRVPTFGKIFSIIDFGRSIFRLGKHLWVSDDHWPDQDAGEQYNFGPFFDHTQPKVPPNPSFDLCRLSVSLIDGLFDKVPPKKKGKGVPIMSEEDSWKVYETSSPLYNLLWNWTVDKNGHTIYQNENGDEKYEGFDLYIRIAHDVTNSVPKDQIHKPIFQQFKWKQKVPKEETAYSIGA